MRRLLLNVAIAVAGIYIIGDELVQELWDRWLHPEDYLDEDK